MSFDHPAAMHAMITTTSRGLRPIAFPALIGLLLVAGLLPAEGCSDGVHPGTQAAAAETTPTFKGRAFDAAGVLSGPVDMPRVIRTDAEWQKRLVPETYRIVRRKGTERPGTGPLLNNHQDGVYVCVACGLPLFGSDAKFESGTGWPSFFRPIAPENMAEHTDDSLGMTRTEILCPRCDAHLGHVFDDGPPPTGLRYCVNSLSLAFTPKEDLATLADPAVITMSNDQAKPASATAVFAGGCFWCVEAVFEELDGVKEAISGYAGGKEETANYPDVCTGTTGHAEAVQIVYDPSRIAYEDLLRVFFATHDPTQLNRQGNDVGTQYRSAIFYANEEQRAIAAAFIEDLTTQKVLDRPIVTRLEPLKGFYPAEPHHQNYVCNNPNQGYVRAIALPKVEKVRKQFKDRLKKTSPLEAH